jgi:hypothetical protein
MNNKGAYIRENTNLVEINGESDGTVRKGWNERNNSRGRRNTVTIIVGW